MRSLARRFDRAVIGIIEDGMRDGSFQSKANAWLIAAGITGMCNWSHRWFEPDRKLDPTLIAEAFSDMVLNGLVTAARSP